MNESCVSRVHDTRVATRVLVAVLLAVSVYRERRSPRPVVYEIRAPEIARNPPPGG